MMFFPDSQVQLQALLASYSADAIYNVDPATGMPCRPAAAHHPVICDGELRYDEEGRFSCPHATVPPDDLRTNDCLRHSIALLILDLGSKL